MWEVRTSVITASAYLDSPTNLATSICGRLGVTEKLEACSLRLSRQKWSGGPLLVAKIGPAGSLLVAKNGPAGLYLSAKSGPALPKTVRYSITE